MQPRWRWTWAAPLALLLLACGQDQRRAGEACVVERAHRVAEAGRDMDVAGDELARGDVGADAAQIVDAGGRVARHDVLHRRSGALVGNMSHVYVGELLELLGTDVLERWGSDPQSQIERGKTHPYDVTLAKLAPPATTQVK